MRTEKRFAVIDTETLGGAAQKYCPCYHLGAVALTKKEILDKINIVIIENLLLDSAFYGQFKKEYYRQLMKQENVIICYSEKEAKEIFSAWLLENSISCVCAYNSGFDFKKTFVKECVEGFPFIDIWFAFLDTIGKYRGYNNYCVENGYVTASNNLKMTAELAYRYISKDFDFVEEHTALSDSEIEAEILKAVWKTHRKFTRNIHKGSKFYVNVKARG